MLNLRICSRKGYIFKTNKVDSGRGIKMCWKDTWFQGIHVWPNCVWLYINDHSETMRLVFLSKLIYIWVICIEKYDIVSKMVCVIFLSLLPVCVVYCCRVYPTTLAMCFIVNVKSIVIINHFFQHFAFFVSEALFIIPLIFLAEKKSWSTMNSLRGIVV